MKVQWRVAVCCAVVLIGWIAAEEADRRKLIIHVPHVHRAVHKHVPRHTHKVASHHGKGHERPGDHIHKHHHHFHDEEQSEGSHGYDDPGHHHTRTYRRLPHHHHSPSGHRHHHHSGHHSHPSHHYDHHGHDSHHVQHHRHPDHHDDDFHSRYRAEESRYHYDHYPEHSHHRPHHYEEEEEYDCMEVCEKCKMKSYHRKHMRAEGDGSTSRPHPHLTVAKFKPSSSSPTPASYVTRGKDEFKPSLAAGELSEDPTGYDGTKYAGYVLPTAIGHTAGPGKQNSVGSPLRNEANVDEYDPPFPSYQNSDFFPSGSWLNNSYFYGKYKDPVEKVVEYDVQRGQIQHTRYGEEETRHVDSKNNDARGRDLRYLNRYKYDIKR